MEPGAEKRTTNRIGLVVLMAVAVVGAVAAIMAFTNRAEPIANVPPPSESTLAPDFTVTLFDGSTFHLAEHLATDGRPVILNLWASWCAPCRAEMPDFDQFQVEQPGIMVIGVAVSDQEVPARSLADELGVSYALGFDASETVAASYPPLGMPSTWFIGQDGTVKKQITGQISLEKLRELSAGSFGF